MLTKIFSVAILFISMSTTAQVSLLSSLDNTEDGGYGGGPDSADVFRTGEAALTITSVRVRIHSTGGGTTQVGFYTDDRGQPSFPTTTQVGSFLTSSEPTTAGIMTYTGTVNLEPRTTYWMVVNIIDEDTDVSYTYDEGPFTSDATTRGAEILERSAWGNDETGEWNDDPATLQYELAGRVTASANVAVPTIPIFGVLTLIALIGGLGMRNRNK